MTTPAAPVGAFTWDAGWRLHPQVALRPEPFGALLYHFGTRKLSFLKSPAVLAAVRALDEHPDARSACASVGVDVDDPATARLYGHALGALAASHMIEAKESVR